jgi:hypothetical protein
MATMTETKVTKVELTKALSEHTGCCLVCEIARKGNQPEMLCEVGQAILAMILER